MTKLMEWLLIGGILSALWGCLITKQIENEFTKTYMPLIIISPIVFLGLFGLYAVTIVLYRVYTFNNCEDAAVELKQQILEAKKELTKQGIIFKE